MALYDDYFTNDDKPFAENLNDALLLSNVFDMTVPIQIPKMFSNSTWVSTTSPRKCGVSILTLKEGLPSGVSVATDSTTGDSTLTGTGTVKLSFYPNFNGFGKFKSMTWENTGTIVVNLKTTTGTTIASNISKGNIENQSSDLRTLQEIVIEIVFTNATLKSFEVVMQNKEGTRYGAEVGINDVTDLDVTLSNIHGKDTQQDNRLINLEGINSTIYNYNLTSSEYNAQIDSTITVSCYCTDINNNPVPFKPLTLKRNGTTVGTSQTNQQGVATWTVTCEDWGLQDFRVANTSIQVSVNGWRKINVSTGELWVNEETRLAVYKFQQTRTVTSTIIYSNVIPVGYRPSMIVRMKGHNSTASIFIIIEPNGDVKLDGGTVPNSINITGQITYAYEIQ